MIQPLRKMHRFTFFALGLALPTLFLAGLVSRPAALSASNPSERISIRPDRGAAFSLNDGASKSMVRLIEGRKNGQAREFQIISDPSFLAPDVFVYWSETSPEKSLSPSAVLLGRLASDKRYESPTPAPGYFVLYSVAQEEVVGSIRVESAR